LTHSSLKGEALHVFNDKQQNKKKRWGILMFNVSAQLRHMYSPRTIHFLSRKGICATSHMFLHLGQSVSFMPGGTNSTIMSMSLCYLDPINTLQRIRWKISSIISSFLSIGSHTCSATSLTLTKCSIKDFFDMMECYQLTDSLDPLLKP
jgi:hypothetical protein